MLINLIIFLAVFSLLVLSHEFGHFISAKLSGMKVEEFGIGFPPRLFSVKKGETVYSINAVPLGGFVKIQGEDGDESSYSDNPEKNLKVDNSRSFSAQPIWKRTIVLSAGVFMNFLLGFILLIPVIAVPIPNKIVVLNVIKDSPAMHAGIKEGDVIEGFKSTDDFINYIKSNAGKEIKIDVVRNGREKEFIVVPTKNSNGEEVIGVGLSESGSSGHPLLQAIWIALKRSISMFLLIFVMLFKLIWSIFTGGNLFSKVAGPVGIYKATALAANMGLIYLLSFTSLISLNLAALNIFPFPALDGGRIIFLIIEKIKGSPVSIKIQQVVNSIGFVLLIVLLLFATFQDIFYR